MKPVRTVAPAELPVTLAEVKASLRVTSSVDDDLITSYLGAAVGHLDGYDGVLGRCLVSQTWAQRFDGWDASFQLPFPDVQSVSVTYLDGDGAEQTLAASNYELIGDMVFFVPEFDAPTLYEASEYPVTCTFAAGYGDAEDVPDPLKAAIKIDVAQMIDGIDVSETHSRLVTPFRAVKP